MDSVLIINCSNGIRLQVVSNDLVETYFDDDSHRHSDDLIKIIDELLIKAKTSIDKIKCICVCNGPGSFTGVRVAISVMKGLAIGNGAKVMPISNFDIYDIPDENYVLVLEGFSNYVYRRKVINGLAEDGCLDINELNSELKNLDVNVYCENKKVQNLLKTLQINSNLLQKDEIFAYNKAVNVNSLNTISDIMPIYLRASQAEIEREKRVRLEKK